MIPHHLNSLVLLASAMLCAVRLRPQHPAFGPEAIFTACLFLLALASLWLWAMAYSRAQAKTRRRRQDLLLRSVYRRASTNK